MPPDHGTAQRTSSLWVPITDDDAVRLGHLAQATGCTKAEIASELLHAALAADLAIEHAAAHQPDGPQEAA